MELDYYQKYIKYKTKYRNLQEGGILGDIPKVYKDMVELKGKAIPPELLVLEYAFLQGTKIDKIYVKKLISYALEYDYTNYIKKKPRFTIINFDIIDIKEFEFTDDMIIKLIKLNSKSEHGLCELGDRGNKVAKDQITDCLNGVTRNSDREKKIINALRLFKFIDRIRNGNINNLRITPELIYIKFLNSIYNTQEFNMSEFSDKLYIGHYIYYLFLINKMSAESSKKKVETSWNMKTNADEIRNVITNNVISNNVVKQINHVIHVMDKKNMPEFHKMRTNGIIDKYDKAITEIVKFDNFIDVYTDSLAIAKPLCVTSCNTPPDKTSVTCVTCIAQSI